MAVSVELAADETEDEEEPGSVGDSRGWAVRDSCEPARLRPPCERPMDPVPRRLSRLLGCIPQYDYPQYYRSAVAVSKKSKLVYQA